MRNVVQACTEMIMPTGGNNEESIFPESELHYKDRASYCKIAFDIEPRRNWITTEFGGYVGIIQFHVVFSGKLSNLTLILLCFWSRISKGF